MKMVDSDVNVLLGTLSMLIKGRVQASLNAISNSIIKELNFSFVDIDECATNSTTCSQVCDNTNGSFNCLCFDGYMLSEDGRTCGDVDECEAGLHECQQLCMNTAGGFRCDCDPGYELNDDSSTCSGK